MSSVVAELVDAKKSYRLGKTDLHALRGVNFQLKQADLCALMGPSGSGKTTLLNVLGCLDVLSSGSYILNGQRIAANDFDDLAELRSRELGFIFQTFNLVPVLTVSENVELSMLCAGKHNAAERARRVKELLEAVGLSEHARHRPDELSGGQRQRVAIARALAPSPSLILADEPTASLDSETASSVLELLVQLNRDTGATILFSTHDPRVLAHARRQVFLRDGVIADDKVINPAPAPAA